jgi:hypothetical protein
MSTTLHILNHALPEAHEVTHGDIEHFVIAAIALAVAHFFTHRKEVHA